MEFVALAPAHLTPNIGPFDTEDEVYSFCEEETLKGNHYRPYVLGGELLPWPRI